MILRCDVVVLVLLLDSGRIISDCFAAKKKKKVSPEHYVAVLSPSPSPSPSPASLHVFFLPFFFPSIS